jgi:hypothetical protein
MVEIYQAPSPALLSTANTRALPQRRFPSPAEEIQEREKDQ